MGPARRAAVAGFIRLWLKDWERTQSDGVALAGPPNLGGLALSPRASPPLLVTGLSFDPFKPCGAGDQAFGVEPVA
jgi:hypothetical protein